MLNFVCILSICLEIILTIICVQKFIELDKKILSYNDKLIEINSTILEINAKVKKVIAKIRKIINIITNKKIIQVLRIINLSIDIIQIVILIRSLDFSKGLKSINTKNLKKIALSHISKEFFKKIFIG